MKNTNVNAVLAARLLELTVANTVKRATSNGSINDLLVKVLYEDKKRMTRVELINELTKIRFEEKFETKIDENFFEDAGLIEQFVKLTKTVKNGVDTSLSRSNNNSSFHFNQNYAKYLLVENSDRTYEMVLRDE